MILDTQTFLDGLEFPESPRWHEGKLWFSDMGAGWVLRAGLDGEVERVAQVPQEPSGLGWLPDGRMLVVSMKDRRLLRLDPGGLAEVADLSRLVSSRCNDMAVDPRGRAYIGTFGYEFADPHAQPKTGEILLVEADGAARLAARELAFPNGMAITPDGRTLIVAEMFAARLTAFDIQADGSLTNRRPWALFDARGFEGRPDVKRVMPDGICLDAQGAIWAASPGGEREVLRVLEGGEITQRVRVENQPFACMLGGVDGRTLFVCTSLLGEKPPGTGRIETVQVDAPGAGYP